MADDLTEQVDPSALAVEDPNQRLGISERVVHGIARQLPRWDALIIVAENDNYPRLHVTWHEGHGFVVQCLDDGESWGFFLATATSFSSPEIEIEMGGQALEKWPGQLFVDSDRAFEALDFFLKAGKQDGTRFWVRTDAFPREIVWETREGREAWENRKQEGRTRSQ